MQMERMTLVRERKYDREDLHVYINVGECTFLLF
jgi:hypothetical protein